MAAKSRRRFGLADIAVVVGLLGFTAGIMGPSLGRAREQGNRVKCASTLRSIGLAIQMYANDNRGNFPRTIFDNAAQPVPTQYTSPNAPNPFQAGGPAPNDVTAAQFLILRTQDLTPQVFMCPSDTRVQGFTGDASKMSNFTGRPEHSYSYINPYPSKQARDLGFKLNFTLTSDFALGSDMNPGGPKLTTVTVASPRSDMRWANSNNHNGDGQNVLYADGHVEFQNTVFCGMLRPQSHRDNIFTAGGPNPRVPQPAPPVIVSAALDEFDSILLPVAPEGPAPMAPAVGKTNMLIWVIVAVVVVGGVIALILTLLLRKPKPAQPPPLPPGYA